MSLLKYSKANINSIETGDNKNEILYEVKYLNGMVAAKCTYIDGNLNGLYERRYFDGTIKQSIQYKDGQIVSIDESNDIFGRSCIIPQGNVLVWKACKTSDGIDVYVNLLVPEKAKRVNLVNTEDSIRVEYVGVISITDKLGNQYNEARSFVTPSDPLIYQVGKLVYAENFSDDMNNENAPGIYVHLYKDQCNQWFKY